MEGESRPDFWGLAHIYTALGDKDDALRSMEAAYEQRIPFTPWFKSANFALLHDDPRFEQLMRRLRLPPP